MEVGRVGRLARVHGLVLVRQFVSGHVLLKPLAFALVVLGGGLPGGLAADRDTSGLTISYRGSSLSEDWPAPSGDLRAGDRAPDAVNRDTGERLFGLLLGPQWNVLVGERPPALGGDARVHPIGEQWQAHDTYGVDQNAVFDVRPDGFVARQATDEPLSRYLSTSGAFSR